MACSGVEGDLSEEWSELFSTMFSPSGLWGVGERERLRRTGEQAGELRFELLAVLQKQEKYPVKNWFSTSKGIQMFVGWRPDTLSTRVPDTLSCGAHVLDEGSSFL